MIVEREAGFGVIREVRFFFPSISIFFFFIWSDYANANALCGLKRAYDAGERRQYIEAMKNNRITF